jgi:putative membrane protein
LIATDTDGSGTVLGPVPGPLRTLLTGVAMGTADLVPGFSGGTVALVAGVYPRLIANIRATARVLSLLLSLRLRSLPGAFRALDWGFLAVLLSGLVAAALLLASTLDGLLETQPVIMSAVFLGLVLGAALVARRQFRAPVTAALIALGVLSAILTGLSLGLRPDAVADPSRLVLGLTAAIAVCAMILPGVSGSFLLLVLGTYEPVIAAIADRDGATIAVVIGGAVVGLLAFATVLDWLLRRAHDLVLALLIGLMVGSARVLWPWPSGTGVGDPTLAAPQGQVLPATVAALLAFIAVVAVDRLVNRVDAPASPPRPNGPSRLGSR